MWSRASFRIWRSLIVPFAALLYVLTSLWMGLSLPGLQYDEAMSRHGAVALLIGDRNPDFVRESRTWISIAGREFPLMTTSYGGATSFYLLLVPFSIFGVTPVVSRSLSVALGAVAIFGIGRTLQRQAGDGAGGATALILAIHPEYVSSILYDNSAIAVWMLNCGLLALAIGRYAEREDRISAFLIGAAAGLGLWGRVNFIWIVSGLMVAAAMVSVIGAFRRRGHLTALMVGTTAGALPLICYEIESRLGTVRFAADAATGTIDIASRLWSALSALGYDDTRAAIWGGEAAPRWQLVSFGAVVLASIVFLAVAGTRTGRAAGVTALVAWALAFVTPAVKPHHFAALLPLAVSCVTIAFALLIRRWRWFMVPAAVLFVTFVAFAIHWNRAAHAGLQATRGRGAWSCAIEDVGRHLVQRSDGRTVRIIDWGFLNNLYVLTKGQVPMQELFWYADEHKTVAGMPWTEVVRSGGLFLVHPPETAHFGKASRGFHQALEQTKARYSVTTFSEPSGAEYARVYDISAAPH